MPLSGLSNITKQYYSMRTELMECLDAHFDPTSDESTFNKSSNAAHLTLFLLNERCVGSCLGYEVSPKTVAASMGTIVGSKLIALIVDYSA